MASALMRTSGSAFRRVISSTSGRERLAVSLPPPSPIGRLTHSAAPPPRSLEEKVDHALQQVKEFDQLYVQGVMELLEQYKAALQTTADHGYFERFLTKCGVTKSKYRDSFVQGCEYTSLFVLSAGFGFVLAQVNTSKNM